MQRAKPVAVVEAPEFISATRDLLDDEERTALIDFLAHHPAAGVLIVGTGGVRKLRWALEGRGKSGGTRVIYFFHNPAMPPYGLTAFAKNRRADLTPADRNDLKRLTALLVRSHEGKGR